MIDLSKLVNWGRDLNNLNNVNLGPLPDPGPRPQILVSYLKYLNSFMENRELNNLNDLNPGPPRPPQTPSQNL